MHKTLEVTTLVALLRRTHAIAAGSAVLLIAGVAGDLAAQTRVQPDPNTPRILVPSLQSADGKLGVQAAEAIRSRLSQDFPYKQLWVISRADVNGTLEASGYKADQVLNPVDASQLARLLRADEYIDGRVEKTADGFRIHAKLVMARDRALTQPLPAVEGKRMDLTAMMVSREIQAARKQYPGERECVNAARDQKYEVAIAAADKAIAAYQGSTLARLCKASVLSFQKKSADEILAIAEQVLKVDSTSRPALALAAESYEQKNDCGRAMELWASHLAADPGNFTSQTNFVSKAAACGQADRAIAVIDSSIARNPGDPQLLRLRFLVLLSGRAWKRAAATGEELVKSDTAAADTIFFRRIAAAYAGDSQPALAAQWVARGLQKFPTNAGLASLHAQLLKDAGQMQQALEAWRRVVSLDPKTPRGFVNISQLYMDMRQPDSALTAFNQAVAGGVDSLTFLGGYALTQANALRKRTDSTTKSRDDYGRALRWAQAADSLSPSMTSKFLVGVLAYQIGQSAIQEADKVKKDKPRACELAKQAQASFLIAQINVPQGGRDNPQAAGQVMQALGQFVPYADGLAKSVCK